MREIKFRAFGKNSKEFLMDNEGYGLTLKEIQSIEDIDTWEFSQFTGLKDKNGKGIYENDILKQDVSNEFGSLLKGQIGQMVWHENGLWAIKFENDSPITFEGNCSAPEIIGNIYQNPELLSNNK